MVNLRLTVAGELYSLATGGHLHHRGLEQFEQLDRCLAGLLVTLRLHHDAHHDAVSHDASSLYPGIVGMSHAVCCAGGAGGAW